MVRYPHECMLEIPGTCIQGTSGDFEFDDPVLITTSCRVEPEFQNLEISDNGLTRKVKHKVYMPFIELDLNNSFLHYNDVRYCIIRSWNYQTHLELWI